MKTLDFGRLKSYDELKIMEELRRLDEKVSPNTQIVLCGSASVLLQGADFRKTMDIDFCSRPTQEVILTIDALWPGKHLFDLNATGVIGLLVDYEDRLVRLRGNFKNLRVYLLSKRDWIVSKLASPKVDDVLFRDDVTMEDLLWVKDHMHEYGGISENRAHSDLAFLIAEIQKRG